MAYCETSRRSTPLGVPNTTSGFPICNCAVDVIETRAPYPPPFADLQRDVPLQPDVASTVHLAHSTGAESINDLVRTNALAR